MPIGILNPGDVGRTTDSRPVAVLSGVNQRRWYSDALNTELRDQDFNSILGQLRYAFDYFAISDVEGDDSMLQRAITAGASTLTGNIAALQVVLGAADRVPYWTSPTIMSSFTATSYSRALLAKTSLLQWQDALGISAAASPNVVALGNLAGGSDQLPYFTGTGTMSQTPFSSAARQLLDDTTTTAMRTTLGLGTMATQSSTAYAQLAAGNTFTATNVFTAGQVINAQAGLTVEMPANDAYLHVNAGTGNEAMLCWGGNIPAAGPMPSRWVMGKDDVAEAAADVGNVGSNFRFSAYGGPNAVGETNLGNVFTVERATRVLDFAVSPTAPTPLTADNSTKVATTAYVTAKIGTGFQPLDADLTALAGLTTAADRLPYFTGAGAAALATYTAFARTLDAAADAAATNALLGLSTVVKLNVTNTVGPTTFIGFPGASQIGTEATTNNGYWIFKQPAGSGGTGSYLGKAYYTASGLIFHIFNKDMMIVSDEVFVEGRLTSESFTINAHLTSIFEPSAFMFMTRDPGNEAAIYGSSFVSFAKSRWAMVLGDNAAETGVSNAGSNFALRSYNDAGTLIGTVISANRNSRVVDFAVGPTVAGGGIPTLAGSNTFTGATNSFTGAITKTVQLHNYKTAGHVALLLGADFGYNANLIWCSGETASRWSMTKDSASEGGGDEVGTPYDGSDFSFDACGGDFIGGPIPGGNVFKVVRATSILTFDKSPLAPTPAAEDNSTKLATTAYVQNELLTLQPYDATLSAYAGFAGSIDLVPYFTAADTLAAMLVTPVARTLLDDADTTNMRLTLGLGTAAIRNTGVSGTSVVPVFSNATNAWTGTHTITLATAAATPLTMVSTDAAGAFGPIMVLRRTSASAATNDDLGQILFDGSSVTPSSTVSYADIYATIVDPTVGSVDGKLTLRAAVNNVLTPILTLNVGAMVGAPTGGDKGAGSLNAVTLWENGVALAATLATYQPLDAQLTAIAGLTPAVDQVVYYTAATTAALMTVSSVARTVLDDTTTAAMLVTLGAAPLASPALTGTPTAPTAGAGANTTQIATTAFVTAAVAAGGGGGGQPLDATLTALAGLATGVDTLPYFTGTDTASQTTLTGFARLLLDDIDAATMRGTLGAAALAAANTWTAAQTFSLATASSVPVSLVQTEAGALGGPYLDLYRDSSTPADGDVGGVLRFYAKDSAAAKVEMGAVESSWATVTVGSRRSYLSFKTFSLNNYNTQMVVGAGVVIGTGTAQGLGTLNAQVALYHNGINLDAKYEPLGKLVGVDTKTASYTLVLADIGKLIELNVASANTLTVPPNSTVAFAIGTRIDLAQYGAGQTTITPGAGVTIRSSGSKLKLTGIYAVASLYKRATDEWVAMGDLSA